MEPAVPSGATTAAPNPAARRRKLILIEPGPPGKHIYSRLKLPRLGAVLLGTIAARLGWEVRVYVEDIAEIDYQDVLTADLVGISTITPTTKRGYAIAEAVEEYGIPVVMGGPHVTFLAEEALAHARFVVRGEGEEALPQLLDAVARGGDLSAVPGLSYRDESGNIHHNPPAPLVRDLDALPAPDFGLIVGWKGTPSFHARPIYPIATSRGCPFGCTFCSVIQMFGRGMRYRSVEHVVDELERIGDPNTHVFFYDDNFTADRRRAKEILTASALRQKLFRSWSAQVRTDAARDGALLDLMKRTGCSNLYVGFETVNPEALRETKKRQTVEDMVAAVQGFNQHGIDVHGMFVLGFDSDTRESLRETIRFAVRSGILSVQFMLLTPLPGTPLFEEFRAAGRLAVSDWSHYDGHHVVFRPRHLSAWDLQWAQMTGHAVFYSRWRTLRQLAKGYLAGSLIYLYARRLNHEWRRMNRDYLKALKLAERARSLKIRFDFELDLSEIHQKVQKAAGALALVRKAAPAAGS